MSGYRFRLDPSQRAHVWALAAVAVIAGNRARSVTQAAAVADELLARLDARAADGLFDVKDEPPEPAR